MKLDIVPLTRAGFAPFGDVITTEDAVHYSINQGSAERFHDLAHIDVGSKGGRPVVSIFIGQPRPRPITILMMERHPLGTQAFVPLHNQHYLIVVGEGETPLAGSLRAFSAEGTQGVNYHRNVWHHPLLVLEPDSRFLVIDRGDNNENLEEAMLSEPVYLSDSMLEKRHGGA
jgi:ureidoglycolate lyase